jgi:hypothetical protein
MSAAWPPGFTALPCPGDPLAAAVARAAAGADPGLVLHRDADARCEMAIVLAPDRPVSDEALLALGTRAVRGALSFLAPVRMPVVISPPENVTVNGGEVAMLTVRRPARAAGIPDWSIPDWIILGIDVAVDLREADPGLHPGRTCLREEGFDTTPAEVMAGICRHLLGEIDAWSAETEAAA